jgi:hypothetical protein
MLVSVCGIFGMLIGGVIADDILAGSPGFTLNELPGLVGFSATEHPDISRWLQGWSGVWCLSAIPCLLAVFLTGLSKTASVSLDRPR